MENQSQKNPVRYSAVEKQQFIDQWKQSGLSRQAFCRQNNLSYYSLINWTRKNGSATSAALGTSSFTAKCIRRKTAANEPECRQASFIPLSVKTGTEQIFAQIETGGKRIQLYQRVTAHFLKQLLR